MNKENLTILANFLENNISDDMFEMWYWRSGKDTDCGVYCKLAEPRQVLQGHEDCGSLGCAIGWAPTCDDLPVADYKFWDTYIHNVFDLDSFSDEYSFMFNANWSKWDNTVKGCVERIRKVVNGYIPERTDLPWGE